MKKRLLSIHLFILFFLISGSIYATPVSIPVSISVGERTITLGGSAAWNDIQTRNGLTQQQSVRYHPVLLLSSMLGNSGIERDNGSFIDMSISFDERDPMRYRDSTGRYRLIVSPEMPVSDPSHSRVGTGAALFGVSAPITIEPLNRNALFAPGSRIGDFTIEFWLYPMNLENGENILSWNTSDVNSFQQITCYSFRNKLHWSFINFFETSTIELSGYTPVIPKTWSHHQIRFDSQTGMVEYSVNSRSETIVYATRTGRENKEVKKA